MREAKRVKLKSKEKSKPKGHKHYMSNSGSIKQHCHDQLLSHKRPNDQPVVQANVQRSNISMRTV